MLSVWFELRFGQKPLLLFGMLGARAVRDRRADRHRRARSALRVPPYVGFRPLLNLVEVCVIVGSVLFVGGLLGEQIAVQRAEVREVRRRLDAAATDDIGR